MNTYITTPAKRYTPFYLTQLILSTVGTSLAILALPVSILDALNYSDVAPVYTGTILADAIVTLVATFALVMLWLKRPIGIWTKLATYLLSLVLLIITLFVSGPVIDKYASDIARDTPDMSLQTAQSLMSAMYYGVMIFAALVTIAMAILWWFAWKGQHKSDANSAE